MAIAGVFIAYLAIYFIAINLQNNNNETKINRVGAA